MSLRAGAAPRVEELTLDGDLGAVPAVAAVGPGTDALPGVAVIHEAGGVDAWIRATVQRFAAAGFIAVAPDLFWRQGLPADADAPARMALLAQSSDLEAMVDLDAALRWARAHPRANGQVGAVGFCFGGRIALLLATSPIAPDRAVNCYGGRITRAKAPVDERHPQVALDRVPHLGCPLLAISGAEDANPSPEDAEELRAALEATGVAHRVLVLPGAGHAFLNDTRPDRWRPAVAAAAWPEILAWLAPLRGPRGAAPHAATAPKL